MIDALPPAPCPSTFAAEVSAPAADTTPCPKCGKPVSPLATTCPHCKAHLVW